MLAVSGGIVFAVLTEETLRRNSIVKGAWLIGVAYGVLALEVFWAMTALPTPYVVDAAAFTVLCALAQHAAIRAFRSAEPTAGLRRLVIASAILIIVLLATARWQ